MPFLRHREQCLCKELQLLNMQAEFARARAEQIALRTNDVAQIEQSEQRIVAFLYRIFAYIDLQLCSILLQVHEARFAHAPHGLDAACNLDPNFRNQLFRSLVAVLPKDLRNRIRKIVALAECLVTECFDLVYTGCALLKQSIFQRQIQVSCGESVIIIVRSGSRL